MTLHQIASVMNAASMKATLSLRARIRKKTCARINRAQGIRW